MGKLPLKQLVPQPAPGTRKPGLAGGFGPGGSSHRRHDGGVELLDIKEQYTVVWVSGAKVLDIPLPFSKPVHVRFEHASSALPVGKPIAVNIVSSRETSPRLPACLKEGRLGEDFRGWRDVKSAELLLAVGGEFLELRRGKVGWFTASADQVRHNLAAPVVAPSGHGRKAIPETQIRENVQAAILADDPSWDDVGPHTVGSVWASRTNVRWRRTRSLGRSGWRRDVPVRQR